MVSDEYLIGLKRGASPSRSPGYLWQEEAKALAHDKTCAWCESLGDFV